MNRKHPVSDEALIEAIKEGDKNAAAWLYHRHVDRIHRICYRIVLDPSQVQDCVQEVWLKVFRNIDRFQCSKSFTSWLNAVTANAAIDYYRKWIKLENHVDDIEIHKREMASYENLTDRKMDGALIRQRIHEALERISVNQRTAFILRYYEEMPVTEIAQTLGCSEGAVRTHISRSLLALRSKLAGKIDF